MKDIDLDLLRCFAIVAETRNFTLAGERMGRSQSAVSIRIRKLEEQLDCRLLVRNNQEVRLTDRGKTLLPKAIALLESGEHLLAEMRGPTISGRLRIGFLEYVAPHRTPAILSAIRRNLPDADLSFRIGLSSHLSTALQQGKLDLAVALHDPESQTSTVFASDPLVWAESEDRMQGEAEETLPVCLMDAPCIYRQAALAALADNKMAFREILTTNSVQSVRSAVASGVGYSVLGLSCIGDGLKVSERFQRWKKLPTAILSLHGSDPRKKDVLTVFQQVFQDRLNLQPPGI